MLGRQLIAGSGGSIDFSSLAGVRALLGSDSGATIGWFHYLAFDMIIGTWVARDGLARGLWPIALVPILALVFMFGPVGFLVYLIVWALFLRGEASGLPCPIAARSSRAAEVCPLPRVDHVSPGRTTSSNCWSVT